MQLKAYNDAHARAARAGAEFLGGLDADEFLVPYADACATTLLARCLARADCGAVSFNWRQSNGVFVVERDRSVPLFRSLRYDVGFRTPRGVVKTFARVGRAFERWGGDAHHARLSRGFRHYRDDGDTAIPREEPEEMRHQTPSQYPAQRAVLYHLYVDDLKTWVKKRSVRGVSDKGCATTCFADLVAIGDEYGRKRLAERGAKLLAKSLNPNEARQRAFMRELEGFLEGVLP